MKQVKTVAMLLCILINTIALPNRAHPCKHQKTNKQSYYNTIATYFHYIKCLSEATYFLSYLHQQHYCYQPCHILTHKNSIQIDSIVFFHPTIKSCIQKMVGSESIAPLLLLLKKVKKYHLLQDYQFFHEFFLLIFTVHKQILFNECEGEAYSLKKTTLTTILEISEKINQLPIAEVLSAIDMLVTELPPFLEKYEFHSTITWKNWFKKYWWVPPVFGAWFGLKILLHLQRQQFYYSPYISPKPQISLQPIITNDPALLEIRQDQNDFHDNDDSRLTSKPLTVHRDPKEKLLCIT